MSWAQLAPGVVEAARQGPARMGGSRLITIDGPAGAGKSTLAALLADELVVVSLIHLDDLYEGWAGLNPDLFARVEAWILLPWSASLPARHLTYDWDQASFTHWTEVPPDKFVIVEGVGAGDAVMRPYTTTSVWLGVSDEVGRMRGLARDAAGSADQGARREAHHRWVGWQRQQADYFSASGNQAAAYFSVDTTDWGR